MKLSSLRLVMGWALIALGLLNVLMIIIGISTDQTLFDLSTSGFMAILFLGFGIPIVYLEMKRRKKN
jgi:hypothetical protein